MVDRLTNYWAQFLMFVGTVFAGTPTVPVKVQRKLRGAGFLEYALIALVAIIIFVIFRGQIQGFINSLWTKIRGDAGI